MEFLKVERVNFFYSNENGEKHQALSNISFCIKKGEYVAITGTNGSGKSTLARLIAGLLPLENGKIFGTAYKTEDFFKNFNISNFKSCKTSLPAQNAQKNTKNTKNTEAIFDILENFYKVPSGMVMQDPKDQIIASILKRDTLFGVQNLKFSKAECEKRADLALDLCGILNLSERQSASLSGGQKQKLALAGILALNPNLLILDEALSMIDPKGRKEILDFAKNFNKKGGTVLSISHNFEEVKEANRVLFLHNGKLEFDGGTESFLKSNDFFITDYHLPKIEKIKNSTQTKNTEYSPRAETFKSPDFFTNPEDFQKTENIENSVQPENFQNSEELSQFNNKKNSETVLQFKNISFAYQNQEKIFNNFNLSIKKGSLCAIMGVSGCGKSTLFEIASGLLKATSGEVLAKSRPVLALQDCVNALFEEFVADDVAYGARKQGLKGKALKECVKNAMQSATIPFEEFADKPIRTLSGGQKRKVALAGIIALNADIFLFDEPTAGLDPKSCSAIFKMFRTLCEQGKTVIFSTHRTEEANAADRKIVINNGIIIEDNCNFFDFAGKSGGDFEVLPENENLKSQHPFEEVSILENFSTNGMGFYCKKNTIVHKLPPLAKWLIMLCFMVCNLVFKNLQVLSIICAISLVYALLARFPIKRLVKSFFAVLPWLCVFFIFQILFFPASTGDTILFQKGFVVLTASKIELSLRTILHFLTALFCLSVFMFSSDEPDILDGMNSLLKPLAVFGVPIQHVSLGMSVIFRFFPLLTEEACSIIKAQLVRSGGNFKPVEKCKNGKLKNGKMENSAGFEKKKGVRFLAKIKSLIPIFVPLIIRTLKRAETFSEALEARYYN